MGNPQTGHIEIKAGAQVYTLRFSIDAICFLEDVTGKNLPVLVSELSDPGTIKMSLLRDVLHAALRESHPDLSVKEAGELILSAGGMTNVLGKVAEALAAALTGPEASGTPVPPNRAARRRAAAGTGPTS